MSILWLYKTQQLQCSVPIKQNVIRILIYAKVFSVRPFSERPVLTTQVGTV